MQIGFNAPTTGPLIDPDSLGRIVTEGEVLGFDYITISDHIMVPRNLQSKYPYTGTGEFPAGASAAWLEQLTTTAYLAGLTKKLRFVLSVMVVPHRPAVLTAKVLSTIDHLSTGSASAAAAIRRRSHWPIGSSPARACVRAGPSRARANCSPAATPTGSAISGGSRTSASPRSMCGCSAMARRRPCRA